ncbi:outer membrane lipoprotein chaperone LolA [Crenobacter cavernae]|uniref:Outer-membrane lipoprotein carrier protein n=1 Tax=Crenobacter cavernae TaxID=2290923 RepID=A0ABY0FDV2_9NEIS|nr:outer membrane lipoprotein chaperone LolA [Crenobacter cavernae]RXZ44183.1 outer membrane lipoprotein carrier protein LolA [Crenobacter cavernae]
MKKALITLALALPVSAHAAAVAQLKAFIASTKTLSADFTQTVTGGGRQETASGTLEIARPGKFRWSYGKPYQQLIVGDGKTLWLYDQELAQVTKKSLDAALGSSPAALLAGNNAIERDYTLRETGKQGGLEWLAASPKNKDSGFAAIKMGFAAKQLKQMELTDSFGNVTRIAFSRLKKNPAIPAGHFRFTPPAGVDVMNGD